MRVLLTSDLHWFDRWRGPLERAAREAEALRPDVLVLAGDLGEPLSNFRSCLRAFRDVPARLRLALAGNHDVWNREPDPHLGPLGSADLFERHLPRVAREEGFVWLEDEARVLDGIAFAGTMAWYDYSGRDPDLRQDDADYAKLKHLVNNDARWIDWSWSDKDLADRLGRAFLRRLAGVAARAEQVVAVTHVPLFREHIEREGRDESWRFGNAYFFNLTLGEAVLREPKVRHVLSGHTHRESLAVLARPGLAPVRSLVCGSDYGAPKLHLLEV